MFAQKYLFLNISKHAFLPNASLSDATISYSHLIDTTFIPQTYSFAPHSHSSSYVMENKHKQKGSIEWERRIGRKALENEKSSM